MHIIEQASLRLLCCGEALVVVKLEGFDTFRIEDEAAEGGGGILRRHGGVVFERARRTSGGFVSSLGAVVIGDVVVLARCGGDLEVWEAAGRHLEGGYRECDGNIPRW